MKKIISVLILIFFLPCFSYSQDCYTVLKVKGKIVLEKTGQQIKANDEICSNDNLSFYNSDAVAVLHSVSKGRFTIKAVLNNENELSNIIKSSVASVISSTKSNLSTRGNETSELEPDMPYFIVGNFTLKVDNKEYPLNENKFFFLRFNIDDNTYNKKLNNVADKLLMNKEAILNIDGKSLEANKLNSVKLYYYDKTANTSTLFSNFKIIFADEVSLKEELNNYINILKNQKLSDSEILNEILGYVSEIYGRIDEESFLSWIKNNLTL
jgi:hypothetical protein